MTIYYIVSAVIILSQICIKILPRTVHFVFSRLLTQQEKMASEQNTGLRTTERVPDLLAKNLDNLPNAITPNAF